MAASNTLMQSAQYGVQAFERDVKQLFPELVPELTECDGLLHPQMGVLAEAARKAIANRDHRFLSALFSFLDQTIARPDADTEIANAVQISFLEPNDLRGRKGTEAYDLMSPAVAAIVNEAV